jgi:hemolysin D
MLYSCLALFAVLLLWALFGRLDIIAVAEGKLVPETYLKIVQPADSGILREILVKEGDRVEAGQVLMRMDPEVSKADSKILRAELTLKRLQLRRIDAELAGTPLARQAEDPPELFERIEAQYKANRQAYQDALAQEQAGLAKAREELAAAQQVLRKLQEILPTYQAQEAAYEKLGKNSLAGRLQVLDKQRERIEKEQDLKAQERMVQSLKATIAQAEKRLAQITSNYRQQLHNERVEAQAQLEKTRQEWAKQERKNTLLELKAPQAGVIKDLATHTPGAVVSPGTVLMTLVPGDEKLQAEVQVKNEDIGFVHEGQPVKVKLAAYPFQKYGMVEGTVSHVSADATERPQAREDKDTSLDNAPAPLTYKAIISLTAQAIERDGERFALSPGMQVVAEINQGQRTILEYLLSPVQGVFQEAFRER